MKASNGNGNSSEDLLSAFRPRSPLVDIPPQESDEDGDDPSQPWFAVAGGRTVPGLDVIWPDGRRYGFNYGQMLERESWPGKIELTFLAVEPKKIVIEGRKLEELADHISGQRCMRIRPSIRDFQDGQSDVTKVTVMKLG